MRITQLSRCSTFITNRAYSPCYVTGSDFQSRLLRFTSSGFDVIDSGTDIEEETIPGYLAERYYPVKIGEIFISHTNENGYRILKVHVRSWRSPQEVEVLEHLRSLPEEHPGARHVRLSTDWLEVVGPHGVHPCLLYEAAGIELHDFPNVRYVLLALDYLHRVKIIHTDVQPNNLLLGIDDESILSEIEDDEISKPSPRKQLPDRIIYATRGMPARIAESGNQDGLVMPSVYRAPEALLGMEWDNKIDIWAVGQMAWTLFEKRHLLNAGSLDTELDDAMRYAEMIVLLGSPSCEFWDGAKTLKFWEGDGNWRDLAEIPTQTLEARESGLEGDSKISFLEFLRKTFQ
ncbi:kinase-like domain-containing protein [Aspergillus pseudoustus]|uniref:non-specific serine/threonine protein kinase n=1 Tax=Aspergillus pseudoustus TaxID=1810923 RepID=A0ABR4K8A3_9EURO